MDQNFFFDDSHFLLTFSPFHFRVDDSRPEESGEQISLPFGSDFICIFGWEMSRARICDVNYDANCQWVGQDFSFPIGSGRRKLQCDGFIDILWFSFPQSPPLLLFPLNFWRLPRLRFFFYLSEKNKSCLLLIRKDFPHLSLPTWEIGQVGGSHRL